MPFRRGVISGLVVLSATCTIFIFIFVLNANGCTQRSIEAEKDRKWLNISRVLDIPRGSGDVGFDIVQNRRPEAVLYLITVTIPRLIQVPELHRLAQLVKLIPNCVWIIVEDCDYLTEQVAEIIYFYGLGEQTYHLAVPTPEEHKTKHWCEGLVQRNYGLLWVRNQLYDNLVIKAIVYFLNEEYTYSLELFHEMERIEHGKVGVWPVGLTSGMLVERPLIHEGRVVAWNTRWHPQRKFPCDIAGFAISYDTLLEYPFAKFSLDSEDGYTDSDFLEQLVYSLDHLQPLAANCTKVLVWRSEIKHPNVDREPNEPGPVSYLLR